jgi:hypothetical protein
MGSTRPPTPDSPVRSPSDLAMNADERALAEALASSAADDVETIELLVEGFKRSSRPASRFASPRTGPRSVHVANAQHERVMTAPPIVPVALDAELSASEYASPTPRLSYVRPSDHAPVSHQAERDDTGSRKTSPRRPCVLLDNPDARRSPREPSHSPSRDIVVVTPAPAQQLQHDRVSRNLFVDPTVPPFSSAQRRDPPPPPSTARRRAPPPPPPPEYSDAEADTTATPPRALIGALDDEPSLPVPEAALPTPAATARRVRLLPPADSPLERSSRHLVTTAASSPPVVFPGSLADPFEAADAGAAALSPVDTRGRGSAAFPPWPSPSRRQSALLRPETPDYTRQNGPPRSARTAPRVSRGAVGSPLSDTGDYSYSSYSYTYDSNDSDSAYTDSDGDGSEAENWHPGKKRMPGGRTLPGASTSTARPIRGDQQKRPQQQAPQAQSRVASSRQQQTSTNRGAAFVNKRGAAQPVGSVAYARTDPRAPRPQSAVVSASPMIPQRGPGTTFVVQPAKSQSSNAPVAATRGNQRVVPPLRLNSRGGPQQQRQQQAARGTPPPSARSGVATTARTNPASSSWGGSRPPLSARPGRPSNAGAVSPALVNSPGAIRSPVVKQGHPPVHSLTPSASRMPSAGGAPSDLLFSMSPDPNRPGVLRSDIPVPTHRATSSESHPPSEHHERGKVGGSNDPRRRLCC